MTDLGTSDKRRKTFGPAVLLGLAGAGLAAVGGHRAMLHVPDDYWKSVDSAIFGGQAYADINQVEFPLAGALALVVLAGWGVILVARGWFRRAVAVVAALASAGIVAVVVVGGFVQDDDAAADISARLGAPGIDQVPLDPTGWFWGTLAGGMIALAAAVAAVRFAPGWPEMGSRYDAPSSAPGAGSAAPEDNLDIWKAIDEGEDPTA